MVNAKVFSAVAGIGIGLGGAKIYNKITDKPAGCPASTAHVLTNNKLDSKVATAAEMFKEGIKDTATLGGITLGTAGAASLVVGNSNKAANAFKNLIKTAGEKLSQITVKGKDLKNIIKDTKIYSKLNALPLPAKAAIAAGCAAFALLAPTFALTSATKQGYIEGKHEVNNNLKYDKSHICSKGCVA